jgi:hypothetical protein
MIVNNIIQESIGDCFYLNIPLTGSEREIQEWLDTSLFVESIVQDIFSVNNDDNLTVLDVHDQIQSYTALDADAYVDEVVSNIERVEQEEQCLILIP